MFHLYSQAVVKESISFSRVKCLNLSSAQEKTFLVTG